jgi:hypothetical protein
VRFIVRSGGIRRFEFYYPNRVILKFKTILALISCGMKAAAAARISGT